jgi:ABC-type xylose transport system substrate-binding protein
MSKKLLYNLLAVLIVASLVIAGCAPAAGGGSAAGDDVKTVGISMPTKTSTRWISDGESMVKVFEEWATPPTCSLLMTTSRISLPRSKT